MKYRPIINITPKKGWINDPNGFCFYNNKFHLYAQHNPYDIFWGPMHWLHFESNDLIHFSEKGISLKPSENYDNELGCFSGSSIEKDGKLYVLYTGANTNKQVQCLAISDDGHNFIKYNKNPIIDENNLPDEYLISDFRDPKVFYRHNKYYVLVAAKKKDDTGSILLYESNDLYNYSFKSEIYNSKEIEAKMIECPDIVFINEDNDDAILIFSAMHKKQEENKYQNMHNVLYALITFDFENYKIELKSNIDELDLGFDFYTTQTLKKDNKIYLISWQNSWGTNFHAGSEGFNGQLNPIKILTVKNDKLHQQFIFEHNSEYFIKEIEIKKEVSFDKINGRNYLLSFDLEFVGEEVLFKLEDNFVIRINSNLNIINISRYNMDFEQPKDIDISLYERNFSINEKINEIKFDILVDNNSINIHINNGLYSFSSLNFNKNGENIIFDNLNSILKIKNLRFTHYK